MFGNLELAPADPILGLTEAFNADSNPRKINLGVGIYRDENGVTPILECVREAERRVAETSKSKGYLPIPGPPEFGEATQKLLFGEDHPIRAERRARTAQAPGGTGSLRVAGDFLHEHFPAARVWVSDPTWANHIGVFRACEIETIPYPYYSPLSHSLDFTQMMRSVENIPQGDIILLHGCCHNPSGVDPTADQWRALAELIAKRKLLPLIDLAYQGFGDGLREDVTGLMAICDVCEEVIICSSYSKNFGLYRDRVGALTVVARDSNTADKALSHIKRSIRVAYSSPPAHGALIVCTILNDAELTALWESELTAMRDRIASMRKMFVETLSAEGVLTNFEFIKSQKGMFSFSGLSERLVDQLRADFAIYMVRSGRMSVAGMTPSNIGYLCKSIASVLGR